MKLKTLCAWVLIFSLSLDNMFLPFDFGFDFRIQYVVFVLIIPVYLSFFRFKVNLRVLAFILIISGFLMATPFIAGTPMIGAIRQLVLIFICSVPFYFALATYQFDVLPLFKIYLDVALITSGVAVIQFFSFLVHFQPGYDYSYLGFDMSRLDPSSYRVQGWMMEPSFLAYFLIPAVFFSIVKIFNVHTVQINLNRASCILLLCVMVLTGSLIAYVSILLMVALLLYEKYSIFKKPLTLVVLGFLVFAAFIGLYNFSAAVKLRVDDTVEVFTNKSIDYHSVNLSTFHFYNNSLVTWKAISEFPITGVGFGNYYIIYNRYAMPVEGVTELTPDGSSLLFRLISETGILFSIASVLFLFHFRIKMNSLKDLPFKDEGIINNGIFILIIMRLMRMPHYIVLGFPLFLIVYYLTFKRSKNPNEVGSYLKQHA